MKFSAQANILLKALENVQGIVDKKNTNPILANIRLNATDNKLIINATDTEIDIVEQVEAEINTEGSTTVSASMLYETIKKLPAQSSIHIEYKEDKVEIICDNFKGNLSCLPVKDFPSIHIDTLPNKIVLPVENLKELISKTKLSIANDDSRFYLNGIYIHTAKNEKGEQVIRAVSTDSHRLSMVELPCDENFDMPKGVILPKKSSDEIFKLLSKTTDREIKIELSNTRASVSLTNLVLTSKLIDADYPNYQTVIPKSNDKIVTLKRTDFIRALDLVSTYSDIHKSITLDISGNSMTIKAQTSTGVAEQTLTINQTIDPITIGFNSKYIKDICDLIDDENVMINLADSNSPALFKKENQNNEIFVVMPIRLLG